MLHLTKISQKFVNELFGLEVQEYDFACDSIQIVTDLATSKIFGLKIQKMNGAGRYG